jgi:membrane-associated protein
MKLRRYAGFCLLGALTWIPFFLGLGFIFGNQPSIRANFKYVILAIIVISLMPAVLQILSERRKAKEVA